MPDLLLGGDDRSVANAKTSPARETLEQGFLPGSPPGDRSFRPDIEGLRAVAVLLVVLEHAYVWHLTGGFIGVDVFFVISGFVITGLLLRDYAGHGKIKLQAFYARRARRIIPSAVLVIVATVVAERLLVGGSATALVASEARWATIFLANYTPVHGNFFAISPAPLGAYWSLSVEEQFYLVYPALFILVIHLTRERAFRSGILTVLILAVVTSFAWSVISSPGWFGAYISP